MKFEYLPHTADTKFRAYGETLEESFSNAALALFNVMVDTSKVNPVISRELRVEGEDLQALLYSFLEQLIILLDSQNFFLAKVEKMSIKGLRLKATVYGDDAEKYETIGPQVKAVTYNDMIIEKKMVQVVLDI